MSQYFCRREFLYSSIALLGALNFGVICGIPSETIKQWKEEGWDCSSFEFSAWNSVPSLFAIIGPMIATWMLSFLGRRPVQFIFAIAECIFWLLQFITTAKLIWVGIVFRALIGLCLGAFSSITPMVIIEFAPPELVGFYANFNQIGIVLGFVFVYLIQGYTPYWTGYILGAVIGALQAGLVWITPETAPDPVLNKDAKQEKPEEVHEETGGKKESVFSRKYIGKLAIGASMMVIQQFSGVNAFLTSFGETFAKIGVPLNSGLASAISIFAQVIAVFAGAFFIDKFGRRVLWIISTLGITIMLVIYALQVKFEFVNWLPILLLFVYMLFFGTALGPIPWFVVTDLFPLELRSAASSVVSSFNWVSSFAVIFLFPTMEKGLTMFGTLLFFAAIEFLGFLFGIFIMPKDEKKDSEDENEPPAIDDL